MNRAVGLSKKILAVFVGLMLSWGVCQAADTFNRANKFYRDQDFTKAIDGYTELVKAGYQDPDLLYNLGNAYFKSNKPGKAILYYKKALLTAPRDRDIQKNLEYARMLTSSSVSGGSKTNLKELVDLVVKRLSFGEWFFIFEIFFLTGVTGLFFRFVIERKFFKRVSGWLLAVGWPGLLLLGGLLAHKGYYQAWQTRAIVISASAEGFSGPGEKFTKLFSAPEGTGLIVHSEQGNWYQVVLENGYNGWVINTDLGII